MAVEIKVPSVGESINEVFVGEWYVSAGDWVDEDANLVGLETDKATFDVPAPAAGTITSIEKRAGETAGIGEVIARLEPGPKPVGTGISSSKAGKGAAAIGAGKKAEATSRTSARGGTAGHVMPAAARLAAEKQVEPARVRGTGPGGRVLKEDVEDACDRRRRRTCVSGCWA